MGKYCPCAQYSIDVDIEGATRVDDADVRPAPRLHSVAGDLNRRIVEEVRVVCTQAPVLAVEDDEARAPGIVGLRDENACRAFTGFWVHPKVDCEGVLWA